MTFVFVDFCVLQDSFYQFFTHITEVQEIQFLIPHIKKFWFSSIFFVFFRKQIYFPVTAKKNQNSIQCIFVVISNFFMHHKIFCTHFLPWKESLKNANVATTKVTYFLLAMARVLEHFLSLLREPPDFQLF